jgi:CRP-like cAMP-binding protein
MMEEAKIFEGLEKDSMKLVKSIMQKRAYSAGDAVFEEGDIGHEFYIIESGTVDVLKSGVKIGELGKNEVFGEMAIIDNQDRAATIKAQSDIIVQVITREKFEQVKKEDIEAYLTIVLNIAKEISIRLRDIDDKVQRIWKWYVGV